MKPVVNLNRARKAKARIAARQAAVANRAAFGRSKAEKAGAETLKTQASRRLDQARREET